MKAGKELRTYAMGMRPSVQVGKAGLTDHVISEIDVQLEHSEMVKVRFLRSAGPTSVWRERIGKIASDMGATLVEMKGGTAVLYRKARRPPRG